MVLILVMLGCIGTASPYRVSSPTPVASTITLSSPQARSPVQPPSAVTQALSKMMQERNLVHQPVRSTATVDKLGTATQRLGWLSARSGAAVLLLVETTIRPMGYLNGRYRWGVEVRMSVSIPADPTATITESFPIPITLAEIHQQEADALAAAAPQIARRAGILLDRSLRARGALLPE
jgi:hypothetical protein